MFTIGSGSDIGVESIGVRSGRLGQVRDRYEKCFQVHPCVNPIFKLFTVPCGSESGLDSGLSSLARKAQVQL